MLVVCTFTKKHLDYELPAQYRGSELLISNYGPFAPGLRPYEAAMFCYRD